MAKSDLIYVKRGHSAADDPLDKLGLQNMPMAALGTFETCRLPQVMSALRGNPEDICSDRVLPTLTHLRLSAANFAVMQYASLNSGTW